MLFNATVTTRKGWDPHELEAFDLGIISVEDLAVKLALLTTNETLVVQIQLWNQDKLNRMKEEYVRESG